MIDSIFLEGGRGCLILLCQYVNIRKGREAMHPRLWVDARCKYIIETILKVTTGLGNMLGFQFYFFSYKEHVKCTVHVFNIL